MVQLRRALPAGELATAVFLLLLLLFGWPLVRIFDVEGRPALAALYFFSAWALSVLVLFAVARRLRRRLEHGEEES